MHPTHNIKAKAREIVTDELVTGNDLSEEYVQALYKTIDTIIDLATQAERERMICNIVSPQEMQLLKDLYEIAIADDVFDLDSHDSIQRADKIQNCWDALKLIARITGTNK